MANAVLSKFQRHPGAGRFVWSSAEQHNLPIAGDLAMTGLQVFRRDLESSRQGPRVGEHIQRVPQVDDHGQQARFKLMLQLVWSDAVAFHLLQKFLAVAPAIENVRYD